MWHYQINSHPYGPVDQPTILALLANGQITAETLVWTTGMTSWVPLKQSALGSGMPSHQANYPTHAQFHADAKDRTAYILLAVFFGYFGIHNFYAGHTNRAVLQLILTIFTAGFGGALIWVWAVIEAITVTKDAQGVNFK